MNSYWIKFSSGYPACVDAKNEAEARVKAAELSKREVAEVYTLPYPAEPRLNQDSGCPPFCYSPQQCKGKTSCPKSYACSE